MIYRFNDTELDADNYQLLVHGTETSVEPQVFNLILYLIENKDRVVSRDELLDHVWQGRVVSDTSINNSIKSARKALGDDGNKQQVIKTIHSRGYQFIAELITDSATTTAAVQKKHSRRTWPRSFSVVSTAIILMAIFFFWYKNQPAEDVTEQVAAQTVADSKTKTTEITTPQRIAVLPFANSKPNPDTDYLSFALANQIISDLNYLENFSIRPAASIRKFVDQVIDPMAIAQELNVDYVINGNYLMENNIIRLNVEMVDVNNSQLVWRETMLVNFANTFELQDRVAKKVAQGLDVGFKQNYLNQKHRDIPNSALAFEYYLRGISYPHL
jgi:DNA-binding winged-HTH domains